MIYADYNATAPLRPEARAAMVEALSLTGNASSVHAPGRQARKMIERAREQVASAIGAIPQDVIFTSGGTEADTLGVLGALKLLEAPCVLMSPLEHVAVSEPVRRSELPSRSLAVLQDGQVDLEDLSIAVDACVSAGQTPFLCLMLASNETGVVQPVADASAIIHRAGGLVFCDGVQGLGKIPVNVSLLQADYVSLSSHKCGGPQGVGALWVKSVAPLVAMQTGGGQERGLRSGTENTAAIAGFGAAAERAARLDDTKRVENGRDSFERRLKDGAGVTIFGEQTPRLPGTSCFAFDGFPSETQVMAMDLEQVAVSAGSACSSGKVRVSGALAAMGVTPEMAGSALA